MSDAITTDRLDLLPMTPAFLKSTISGLRDNAEAILALKIPSAWFERADFAALRLQQIESGAISPPWVPHAIRLRATSEMVGYIGFHTPPGPAYLKSVCPAGVEFGYTIFPEHRRRRFAWEAAHGLIKWAQVTQGTTSFVVSVSPDNVASLSLISKMGFRHIGSHIDEEDGPEDIFALVVDELKTHNQAPEPTPGSATLRAASR